MRAGQLRHRVTIQQATETPSASGALVLAWSKFAERSGFIESGSSQVYGYSREFEAARLRHAELTHLIIIRGYCAVNEKMRVMTGDGRIFELIGAYAPDGRACVNAPEVHLACREIL